MFFISKDDLHQAIYGALWGNDRNVAVLTKEVAKLKEEKAELEFKKKLEEKEIAQLVKMKEEKIHIETEKERLSLTQKFQEKEMELQKNYFDRVMVTVKEGQDKMEDIYGKILERLPNVNMEIRRGGK